MKQFKHILPMLAVIVWFTHYDKLHHAHTQIDIWHNADGVKVQVVPVDGSLMVIPVWHVFDFPVGREESGGGYMHCNWTVFDDENLAALYVNHLKEEYKIMAPVDDVRLEPETSAQENKK